MNKLNQIYDLITDVITSKRDVIKSLESKRECKLSGKVMLEMQKLIKCLGYVDELKEPEVSIENKVQEGATKLTWEYLIDKSLYFRKLDDRMNRDLKPKNKKVLIYIIIVFFLELPSSHRLSFMNKELLEYSGLKSVPTIISYRNKLVDKGYISYTKRGTREAGEYELINYSEFLNEYKQLSREVVA